MQRSPVQGREVLSILSLVSHFCPLVHCVSVPPPPPPLQQCSNVCWRGGGIARGARSSHLARIRRLQASKPEQAAAPESTGHKELFQCDVVFTLSDTCCRKSIWHCGECTDCPPPAVAPPRPKNVHSARIGPSCKILFITVSASSMFLMLSCLHFYSPCTRCRRLPSFDFNFVMERRLLTPLLTVMSEWDRLRFGASSSH